MSNRPEGIEQKIISTTAENVIGVKYGSIKFIFSYNSFSSNFDETTSSFALRRCQTTKNEID